jgi:hypothetical protein
MSPAHQMTHADGSDPTASVPLAHRLVTPMLALIVVLTGAASPASARTSRTRSSPTPKSARRSSHAPASASKVLPSAIAALTHSGTDVEALNSSAPSATPGTARRPSSRTAARAIRWAARWARCWSGRRQARTRPWHPPRTRRRAAPSPQGRLPPTVLRGPAAYRAIGREAPPSRPPKQTDQNRQGVHDLAQCPKKSGSAATTSSPLEPAGGRRRRRRGLGAGPCPSGSDQVRAVVELRQ